MTIYAVDGEWVWCVEEDLMDRISLTTMLWGDDGSKPSPIGGSGADQSGTRQRCTSIAFNGWWQNGTRRPKDRSTPSSSSSSLPPPSSACLPLSFGPERQLFRRLFFFTLRWSHRLASTAIYSFAGFLYNAIHFTWVYWVKHDSLFFWSMGFHCFTVYYVVTICNCKVWSSFTGFIRRFCGFFLFFLGFTWFYRSIWFNAIFLNATILHFGWDRLCDINWAASSFKHVLSVIRASISDTSEMRVSHARELRHSALWNIWPNATGLHNLFLILFALSHLFS